MHDLGLVFLASKRTAGALDKLGRLGERIEDLVLELDQPRDYGLVVVLVAN
jgi:hypothetical protein